MICFPSSIFHIYEKIICKESSRLVTLDWTAGRGGPFKFLGCDENPGNLLPAVFVLIRSNDGQSIFLMQNFRPDLGWVSG